MGRARAYAVGSCSESERFYSEGDRFFSESEREEEGRPRAIRRSCSVCSVSESERSERSERSDTDYDSPRPTARAGARRFDRDDRRTTPYHKKTPAATRRWWLSLLLAVLFFCGPVGTIVSFWLLPKEDRQLTAPAPLALDAYGGALFTEPRAARMLHLTLVGSSRRARFLLDEQTDWESFMVGCQERLGVDTILRVTDSSGEAIFAVEDLVHDDQESSRRGKRWHVTTRGREGMGRESLQSTKRTSLAPALPTCHTPFFRPWITALVSPIGRADPHARSSAPPPPTPPHPPLPSPPPADPRARRRRGRNWRRGAAKTVTLGWEQVLFSHSPISTHMSHRISPVYHRHSVSLRLAAREGEAVEMCGLSRSLRRVPCSKSSRRCIRRRRGWGKVGGGGGGRSLGEMAKAKAPRAAAAAHGRPAEMIRPLSSIAHANKA